MRPGPNTPAITCTDDAAEAKRTALERAQPLVTAEGGDKAAAMERLIARVQLQAGLDKASVIKTPLSDFVAAAMGRSALAETQSKAIEKSEGDLIERLLAGPDDAELSPRDLALLEANLRQPSNRPTLRELADAANGQGQSERSTRLGKLKLIRDFNRNLHSAASTAEHAPKQPAPQPMSEPATDAMAAPALTTGEPRRRGRRKADHETVQQEAQVAADWERARDTGMYKGDFVKERGTTVAKLDALLDRVAKRKRASE